MRMLFAGAAAIALLAWTQFGQRPPKPYDWNCAVRIHAAALRVSRASASFEETIGYQSAAYSLNELLRVQHQAYGAPNRITATAMNARESLYDLLDSIGHAPIQRPVYDGPALARASLGLLEFALAGALLRLAGPAACDVDSLVPSSADDSLEAAHEKLRRVKVLIDTRY